MFIINSIAPIFLLIALGKLLYKTGFLPESFFKGVNKLVFWIALPALLISKICVAQLEFSTISKIFLLASLGTLLTLALAWGVSKQLKLPTQKTGSFLQGTFRGNGAFIGLPVIIYTLGELDPQAEILGTVVLAPLVILFNLLSVPTLSRYSSFKECKGASLRNVLMQFIKNPLILACAIGLILNLSDLALPCFAIRALNTLGNAALPLILMSIGATLIIERLSDTAPAALIASVIKVAIAPSIGFLLAPLFNLEPTEKMIAIFYLACPTAVMSYVMAEAMGNDGPLAGRIVTLSTLLSGITLPIIIAIGL
ncbi:MAG TPA: AEC family transporter [Pontiella sp.]